MAALRLKWWEGGLLVLPGVIAFLFFAAGQVTTGVVLAALVVVVVASRAQIPERNVPGGYARTRSLLLLVQWGALMAIYAVIVVFFFVMRREHWTRDRHGTIAFYALVGLSFFLVREIYRIGEKSTDWWLGSEAEREVARRLDTLRAEGWLVVHDVKKDGGGNVDHFVSGPTGAFAIETKSGRNRAAARNQAISNAVWVKDKFGARWVTAVVCVGTDPPPQPLQQGHAWVLGADDLVEFLRQRR